MPNRKTPTWEGDANTTNNVLARVLGALGHRRQVRPEPLVRWNALAKRVEHSFRTDKYNMAYQAYNLRNVNTQS